MSREKEFSGMEGDYKKWDKKAPLCVSLHSLQKSPRSKISLNSGVFLIPQLKLGARQDEC